MKTLTKNLVSCAVLGSALTLTACQSMPMGQNHSTNDTVQHMDKDVVKLTEGQIIKVLSTANRGEILQAKVAMPKLQSPVVRSFAESMIEKHTANEMKGLNLAQRMRIAPQVSHTSNALQVDSNNMVTQLSKTAAPADKQYIMAQIKVHDKVLKTIENDLLPNAKNDELRNFLKETHTAVAMHLEVAQKIAAQMS